MKKVTLRKNGCIYCVVASNTNYLSRIFVRLQEFYESPFKEIRGKHFTLEQFRTIYTNGKKSFTYYDDWAGFNVPGHVVINFFNLFTDLSPKEKMLKKLLQEALESAEKFYVIGVPRRLNKSIMEHEVSHALFYTNPVYKQTMLRHGKKLSARIKRYVFSKLKKMGYSGIVKYDELQAYLATSRLTDLNHYFGNHITITHIRPFRETFKHYAK